MQLAENRVGGACPERRLAFPNNVITTMRISSHHAGVGASGVVGHLFTLSVNLYGGNPNDDSRRSFALAGMVKAL